MIAFPELLIEPAKKAGIKVPDNVSKYDKQDFMHWHVFCTVQLGASMPNWTVHWENARVIANIPEEEINKVTYQDLLSKGLQA